MNRLSAINDFYEAHRKASLQIVLSKLTGESADLLSYDEVLKRLRVEGQTDRGRAEIPLDKIVGSVGRYTDFTRDFLPRRESDLGRWATVKMATESMTGVPPIDVYKIGDVYFVRDGNHRVSIARMNKQEYIEGNVTEVFTRVPFDAKMDLDSLIIKEEYAQFLEETRIDRLIKEPINLSVTVAGAYEKILEHISVHRYYMGIDEKREVPYSEAVVSWYQKVYRPVIDVIHEQALLRDYPNRTETDLYIWMLEHRAELEKELGWKIDTDTAADSIGEKLSRNIWYYVRRFWYWLIDLVIPEQFMFGPKPGVWRRKHNPLTLKNLSLFRNILIALQGDEISHQTLEQAIWIAKKEGSRLSALHLVDSEEAKENESTLAIRNQFYWRLHEEGLDGSLVVEIGTANQKIIERAVYTDMVVVHLQYAPGTQAFAKMRSGFRLLIRQVATPLLVIPKQMRPIQRILLAFDGSQKAKEASYIAVYLAKHWGVELYLLTVFRDANAKEKIRGKFLDSQRYIIDHNVRPHAHMRKGLTGATILAFAKEKNIDMILMGSYGSAPFKEIISGSTIDYVLESVEIPVLICR
ncbi:MAG: hypothetical protein BGO78_11440 [Chloroflexi bacterium 44-23]|nr:MAG: hypothetical protein BGO78_11440 [Chloroflexi bacterium 44-23]